MIRYFLVFIFSLNIITSIFSQELIESDNTIQFNNLTNKNGLSVNRIQTFLQDDAGFIWIGTTNGINVYDGFGFKKFQNIPTDSNTLSNNVVNDLEIDKSGVIWIGCNSALNAYDPRKKVFSNRTNEILIDKNNSSLTILSLLFDGINKVWIGSENGLYSYCLELRTFENYNSDTILDKLIGKGVYSLYLDRSNDIWISSEKGVCIYNSKQNKFYKVKENINEVISVQEINNTGNFYVATSTEILKVNKTNKTSEIYFSLKEFTLADKLITSLLYDKKGNLWIGTTDGLILKSFYSGVFERFQHSSSNVSSLVDNFVTTLFEDKAGIIWIGTNGGISVYDSRNLKFKPFVYSSDKKNGLSSSFVWGLIEDTEGFLWLGTDYGLNKFDLKNNSYKYFLNDPKDKGSLVNNRVISICEDIDGFIWLGTDQGICKLNKKTEKFEEIRDQKNHEGLYNDYIISIKADKKGDLWFGSDSHGLFHYSKKTDKFESFIYNTEDPNSLSSDIVYCVYIDNSYNVWIGTNKGLNLYNQKANNFIKIELANSNFQESVLSVSKYNDSLLFVGTSSGLYKIVLNFNDFTVKKSILYTIANGLPDNRICGLVVDFKQNLWISTKNGLCRILKNDLFKQSNDDFLKIRTYDETEGLQSNEFLVQSFYSGNEGRLLFGGTKGFNIFNPDDINDNHFIPNVVITDFLIFNKPVEPLRDSLVKNPYNNVSFIDNKYFINDNISFTKQITLSYYEKMFTINFVSLHLSKPWKNSYAYKLDGFDNDWNYVGNQHSATYTNIPAGTYNFKVIATNADGVWNDFGTTLKIIITPPWWQTWWFRILIITTIIVLFVLYVKIRERKLIKDKQHLEKIVEERTKELVNKNEELQQQKEEIESQRDEIESQRDEIVRSRDIVLEQKSQLELIHNELTSSIHYALRIQNAILPSADFFNGLVSDYFVINRPKDIISGDFYWFQKRNDYLLIAVADCTGHGVPGAFMSMLGIAYLNEICSRSEITTAAAVLNELRTKIISSLKQNSDISDSDKSLLQLRDGMDISLIAIKTQTQSQKPKVPSEELTNCPLEKRCADPVEVGAKGIDITYEAQWAGANNPIWIVSRFKFEVSGLTENEQTSLTNLKHETSNHKLFELKADKMPISTYERMDNFTNHEFQLQTSDTIYLMSDGYEDQFGGPDNKKFKAKNLKNLLIKNSHLPMIEQKNNLEIELEEWIGNVEQVDDITLLGIKL